MRRFATIALLAALASLPLWAGDEVKGQFDLFLNGINKGHERFKIRKNPKDGLLSVSSEVRFKLPMEKAKRNYIELYLYPTMDLDLQTLELESYKYRMSFNDFSDTDMVEAQDSATEVVDQHLRQYDLLNRSAQVQRDEMANHIDMGVNAGQCVPIGATLHFQQYRFSQSRVKDEPLPGKLVVLDAYTFVSYLPLAKRALAMQGDEEQVSIAFPQGMRLKQGKVVYIATEKTPFRGATYILKHFDVTSDNETLSSFWVDQAGTVIQVVVPSEGLVASLAKHEPKPFEREEARVARATVEVKGSFLEKPVHVPSGGITLGATLTLPSGTGPFPTVLMVQDLLPADRDGNDPGNPYSRAGTWKQLAYCLASEGFASLRYDVRGVGESGGGLEKVMPEDRVGDIQALAAWLKGQPTTRGGKVFLLASGLGGWHGARAAARDGVAGFVAISYPAKGLWRLWKEQVGGISDPEARQQAYLELDTMSGRVTGATPEEWVTFRGQKIYFPAVKELSSWDPVALASGVKAPCLFAYPDKDQTVMAFHREVLAPALHAGQEVILLEGVGHRLTAMDQEAGPSGLVECKKLASVYRWLSQQQPEAGP